MNVNKTEKIIGAIVVAAIALSGGSYWTGSWIEQEFRENVDWIAARGIAVSVVDYQRGIFGATARTDWASPVGTVSFIHNIRHGPLPALTAAARIHTEVQLSEDVITQIKENFGNNPLEGKEPLAFDTVFGWAGGYRLHTVLPKLEAVFKEDQTKVSWGGLNAEITVSSKQSHKKADIVIENLSIIKGDEDFFQVDHATLKSDMTRIKEFAHVHSGTTGIVLNKIQVRGKDPSGAIHGIEFENFRAMGDSSVKDGAVVTGMKLDVDKIIVEGDENEKIDHLKMAFLLENIDAKAYDAVMDAMQKNLNDQDEQVDGGEDQGQAMAAVLQEQGKALLLRKPTFSIKDISVRWPEGAVTGNFRIAYVGDGNPSNLSLSNLSGDLQMALPRALVVRYMTSQASERISDSLEDGEENEVNIGEETKEQVDKQMAEMLASGLFVEKGDTLSIDAHLQNGELNLNGKPQPLRF